MIDKIETADDELQPGQECTVRPVAAPAPTSQTGIADETTFTPYTRGFEILRQLNPELTRARAIIPRNAGEAEQKELRIIALRQRIDAVKARTFNLQQGATVIHIDTQQAQFDRSQLLDSGPQEREIRRAACLQAQQSGDWKHQAFSPSRQIDPVIADVITAGNVQSSIVNVIDAMLGIEVLQLDNWGFLYPLQRSEEIKHRIHQPGVSREEMLALSREATDLQAVHAAVVCNSAHQDVVNEHRTRLEPAMRALLQAALAEVKTKQAAAIAAEKEFCQKHGVAWKPGPVSQKYDAALRQLQPGEITRHTPHLAGASTGAIFEASSSPLARVFGIDFDPIALAAQ